METERDSLAAIIKENAWPTIDRTLEGTEDAADAILDAGFRRVDADHVVVRRSDAKSAVGFWEYVTEDYHGTLPGDWVTNLRHALSADGEDQ